MINVTYIHHSGFAVETDKNVLIFDYYTEGGKIPSLDIEKFNNKNIYFFVSHSHGDHFDKKIFDYRNNNVKFILSDDVDKKYISDDVIMVTPHCKYNIDDISIETLLSNDMGVAFIVNCDNKTIYHSGDLNWWHWNGEPDNWNKSMGEIYKNEVSLLTGKHIDVAFVPVDPRLEENYILAIDYIMKNVDIDYVLPMHFWGDFNVYDRLISDEKSNSYRDKIIKISHTMENFKIE